jgi:hypothetical protein
MLVYECSPNFERDYINVKGVPKPGSCYPFQKEMEQSAKVWAEALNYCRRISLVWAVGGEYVNDKKSYNYP